MSEGSARKSFHLVHLGLLHPQILLLVVQSFSLHPVGSLALASTEKTALKLFLSGHNRCQWLPKGLESTRSSAAGLSLLNGAHRELSRALKTHQCPRARPAAPPRAKPLLCAAGKSLSVPSSQPFSLPPQPVLGFVDLSTTGPELCPGFHCC